MLIRCKKTGEEYEITDREIGEKIECPCCGEKFVVNDKILPQGAYTATLIRKTATLTSDPDVLDFDEVLYEHGKEGEYERLFNKAYEDKDADAQLELAKCLIEKENEPELARFWYNEAAKRENAEAECWMAKWHWQKGEFEDSVWQYKKSAEHGNEVAKAQVEKIEFNEFKGVEGCGKTAYENICKRIRDDKKLQEYLCEKYCVRAAFPFWSDTALPDYGTPKGMSYIIGSFCNESEVPRELLAEISHLIGRRLTYCGRYVDAGISGETKFLFCYAVSSSFDDPDDGEDVEPNHISDLLQLELDLESGEWDRRRLTWRETIEMNCPLCEAQLTLPTRLLGGKVRCLYCSGEFLAKGEGIMTTAERKRDRSEKRFEAAAADFKHFLMKDGGPWTALSLSFSAGGYGLECESIGEGWNRPWPGVYLQMWFKGEECPNIENVRNMLESILGCWVRYTGWSNNYWFYLRQDRPCKQNEVVKFEIEKQKEESRAARERSTSSDVPKHPVVKAREDEASRLEYLMWGGGERSINEFDFQEYLRKKYKISKLFVCNYPPGDIFAGWHGFDDGFGIVVETKTKPPADVFPKFVRDLEKRFSRKLTLVKTRGDDIIEYCFTVSMPNQGVATQLRLPPRISTQSKVAEEHETAINERTTKMKRTTTSAPQHIGNGTMVDWSQENKAFAEMIARHGISKFHVEMVNPYCAEISIPMNVNENTVRKFANDLFHELDVLDADCELDFGQNTDCSVLDINEGARCYYVVFNQHEAKDAAPGDAMYKYKVEAISAGSEDYEDDDSDEPTSGELTPAQIMKYIAEGIKSGAIKSKSGEGYFVLKGEFFDAIKAGRKTTEYRDLSPRNLSKSIGIKTVKLQRGYGHPGQPPEQMRFEVSSVGLLDADDRECDPYNIPDGFIATTIAIHLGKRIG